MKTYLRSIVSFLVCLFFFPVLCAARTDALSGASAMPEKQPVNGTFTIFVQEDGAWKKVGTLSFDRHLAEKNLSLNGHAGTNGKIAVKIEQHGGGAAHIDSVFLDGKPPVEVKGIENGLIKLSKKDSDVIDAFGRAIEVAFDAGTAKSTLSLAARIESTVISKVPFQFPPVNTYRKLDRRSSFYTYRLDTERRGMQLDGMIEEVAGRKPFFREFSETGSGHPSGYTYGWVWNDDRNLYVAMDFTPDNTMDGDKDYAKVYTMVDGRVREFKVSVPEQTWGVAGFTYTGNAAYQHKTYEFSLPLTEIFPEGTERQKDIRLAFAAYGTATPVPCPTQPDITYTCPFAVKAPTIDGTVSAAEWPGSPRFNIPGPINTYFYCMVDATNLYVMVDAVGDTTPSFNHDTCDECLMTFWQGGVSPKRTGEIYTETGPTLVPQMPAGGSGVVGFGTSQNSLGAHRTYEWKFPLSSINAVPGGSVFFASPAVFKTLCGSAASMPYDGTLNVDNIWPTCLNEGDSATWGVLQFPPDTDADGIPDEIEDGAPNGGDGNGDGIPDKFQRDVTSLPSTSGSGYLTLQIDEPLTLIGPASVRRSDTVISGNCQNAAVQSLTAGSLPLQDSAFFFPFDLLSFSVSECVGGGQVLVTVYYHGSSGLSSFTYRKYGPFPTPSGPVQWYTMPGVTFGTALVGGVQVPTASFVIIDNGTGDDDGTVGIIVDQGGPGQPSAGVPTVNEWGMVIFVLLAGFGAAYHLRRQKRT